MKAKLLSHAASSAKLLSFPHRSATDTSSPAATIAGSARFARKSCPTRCASLRTTDSRIRENSAIPARPAPNASNVETPSRPTSADYTPKVARKPKPVKSAASCSPS
uniref:(northern house mosquito) hypothetical protein n=1 Tax=Culex pipiens TaxID=7175 RepID=A0A8D8GF57_CULPI